MSKLTTMQIDALASACAREDGLAVRPTTLKPAAAAKIAAKLIELGSVRSLRAKWEMPVWRVNEDGEAISLKVLKAGRLAWQRRCRGRASRRLREAKYLRTATIERQGP